MSAVTLTGAVWAARSPAVFTRASTESLRGARAAQSDRPFVRASAALRGVVRDGLIADDEDLRAAGIGCSTSVLANTLARYMIGRTTGRVRPRYTQDPYDFRFFKAAAWERRSFPNGHGANIMSCVAYWNHYFDLGVARPLLYFVAVAIGSARTTAEAHWMSDTVFGLVLGYAVGKGVAARFSGRTTAEFRELQALQDGTRSHQGVVIGWRIPVR